MASKYLRRNRYYFRLRRRNGTWTSVWSSYVKGEEDAADKALQNMEALSAATAKLVPIADGPLTLAKYSKIWIKEREEAGVVDWQGDHGKMRDHVLPFMGDMELNSIRPEHILALIKNLRTSPREIGRKTRQNVYGLLKALFRDAKIEGVFVGDNPCILPPQSFGVEHEKDPEWRAGAVFDRSELVMLLTTDLIPEDRRVFYAVQGVGACRLGEGAALLVRNIDLDKTPLGSMLVARSHSKNWTKGQSARQVPIHPALHKMLKHWLEVGWERMMGRPPGPDDLLLPLPPEDAGRRRGDRTRLPRRSKTYAYKRFKADLENLGLRHRREQDLRRTAVTLMREDGARKEVLVLITHNPRKETIDMYTEFTWKLRCNEVMKLQLDLSVPTGNAGSSGAGSSGEPDTTTTSTALVKIAGKAMAAEAFATEFATNDGKSEQNQELTLWRRRVLPTGTCRWCSVSDGANQLRERLCWAIAANTHK
jgi:integrase